jgi:hypothetical protein
MASPKVGQIRPQTPPGIQESDGGTGHWLGRRDGIGIQRPRRPARRRVPKFLSMLMLLRFVFKRRVLRGTSQVLIYTDTLPFTKREALAVEIASKSSC